MENKERYCEDCRWVHYRYVGKTSAAAFWCDKKNVELGPRVDALEACELFEPAPAGPEPDPDEYRP